MRKKLLLLELALITVSMLAGMQVRENWLESRKRAAVVLGKRVKPLPPPPYSASPFPPLPTATDYGHVTERLLFSNDRSPAVVMDSAPPRIMPQLPVVHGVFDLGDGPIAIMAANAGGPHQQVRTGGRIGDFKLVSAGAESITLEWEGKEFTKAIAELADRGGGTAQQAAWARTPVAGVSSVGSSLMGPDAGGGHRACQAGENSPAGTISDGYRKVVLNSPFGQICRWAKAG